MYTIFFTRKIGWILYLKNIYIGKNFHLQLETIINGFQERHFDYQIFTLFIFNIASSFIKKFNY